jgi:hypothetical protein
MKNKNFIFCEMINDTNSGKTIVNLIWDIFDNKKKCYFILSEFEEDPLKVNKNLNVINHLGDI